MKAEWVVREWKVRTGLIEGKITRFEEGREAEEYRIHETNGRGLLRHAVMDGGVWTERSAEEVPFPARRALKLIGTRQAVIELMTGGAL